MTKGQRTRPQFDPARLRPLGRAFYSRDTRQVARSLLGKVLVRRMGRKTLAGRIVEVEAYLGEGDLAAHSAAGKTARNEVLFGPPGYVYVYFIYGNHYCLNVSCEPDGTAGGVLIRALEPLAGLEQMARARDIWDCFESSHPRLLRALTSGPGRLCEAMSITRERDNGKDITDRRSDLWIGNDGARPKVAVTPRIGIAANRDAHHPLRYIVADSPFVSR